MVALKSTSSRCPIPTPLHQPTLHYLSEDSIGSADLREAIGQLQLPVRCVEVGQRDDEDGRQILPPTILREQQRSTCTTCVEVAGRTFLRLGKPCVGSAAAGNRPQTARRAAQDRRPRRRWRRRSSSAHPAKPPFNPTSTTLRRSRGREMLSEGLIATSHAFSLSPYKGSMGSAAGAHHHLAPPDRDARLACRNL